MAVNENVYGTSNKWIAPTARTELGNSVSASVFYYNDILADETKQIKIANFNTKNAPVTNFASQMVGAYSGYTYDIRNNYAPTQTETIDTSIVQFGIGSQSGLSNIDYMGYYFDANATTASSTVPVKITSDNYDITNIAFALNCDYIPRFNFSRGDVSTLPSGDAKIQGWQYASYQLWGDSECSFSISDDSTFGYHPHSGYANSRFITQIPIKNLKIYPKITAYDNSGNAHEYTSITTYLNNKNTYPFLGCIQAVFIYQTGSIANSYDFTVNIMPLYLNKTNVFNGYRAGNITRTDNIWYLRHNRNIFTIAGFDRGDKSTNILYQYTKLYTQSYETIQISPVLQTPDFYFEYQPDHGGITACDVSSMSNNDIEHGILKQLASFGLFFVADYADRNEPLDSDKTYLGVLENGIAYGAYTNGANNRNQLQWTWDYMNENEYDPEHPLPHDPNTYDGEMSTGALPVFTTATTRYNISTTNFITLTNKLWDAMALADPDNVNNYSLDTFLTSNPIDSIVSLKWFPVSESMAFGPTVNVNLGKYDTGINANAALTTIIKNCGDVTIYPVSGNGVANWIDKLTKITLYLPFCGSLELDPETYMGRSVNVEYSIDLITGSCAAYVSYIADNGKRVITDIANGSCAIDCPVTGLQHVTLDSQLYNATEQLKAMRVNNAISGLNSLLGLSDVRDKGISGIADIANAGGNIYNALHNESVAEYNLHHTQTPMKMIGTTSPMTGCMCELLPVIIFERPVIPTIDETSYSHSCGYACCIPDTIGNFTGYAEFASADLSGFSATNTEKQMILSLLKGGVIL